MPIAYRADRALQCTISVWDGDVTDAQVRDHLLRLSEDPDWLPGPLHLTDLTTVGRVTIPDPELLALLYEGTNAPRELKIAIVVGDDFDMRFGTTVRAASDVLTTHAFSHLDEACAYLGVSSVAAGTVIADLRRELGAGPGGRSYA